MLGDFGDCSAVYSHRPSPYSARLARRGVVKAQPPAGRVGGNLGVAVPFGGDVAQSLRKHL